MINERYLFRGKRLGNRKFTEGSLRSWTIDGQRGRRGNQIIIESGLAYDVHPFTIGQCTGLKDINGRLIFEGDILKCAAEFLGAEGEYACAVVWEDCGWVTRETGNDGYNVLDEIDVEEFKMRVVGNIHDNPELLKGGSYE
jgi:uncharacterized phage protein (TIGR01671 family)